MIQKGFWNNHGAVLVGNNNVVGEDCHAAATDGLAPTHKCQAGDRRRGRVAVTPNGQTRAQNAFDVAHHAIGNERCNAALGHACAQNIAKNSRVGDAHGIHHRDTTFRHRFDRGSGRYRGRPRFRRCEIFARRHETQGEGLSDQPLLTWPQRSRTPHPNVPQPLFEKNRGDGRGGNVGKRGDRFGGQRHRKDSSGLKKWIGGASCGARASRQGLSAMPARCVGSASGRAYREWLVSLLKENAYLAQTEFHFTSKRAKSAADRSEFGTMAAPLSPPRLLPNGDAAITVEFARNIDDAANARVLALDRRLGTEPIDGITETVPTYRSLLVHYDPTRIDFEVLSGKLHELSLAPVLPTQSARHWRIPVAYGGEHGIDLEDFAKTLGVSPDAVVARHIASEYRVAMIGFSPGWSYLSGLKDSLQMPRRQNPRLLTPAGTVSIGGVQTGVQCLAGPSGWHLLGQTAVRTYQLHRDPTFLLEPGDAVSFTPVDPKTFAEQDRAAAAGEIVAELLTS